MADNYLEKKMDDLRSGRGMAHPRPLRATAVSRCLAGLRAVVTGGAGGIGREISAQFCRQGAAVDILDIDSRKGTAAAQATGARFRPVDLADSAAFGACMRDILKDRKDVDIIVNCAAVVDFMPLEENSPERFMKSMQTNVMPVFEGARLLAIHRRSLTQPNPYGGRIINISSTRAIMSEKSTESYSASKGAIGSLTHALMMSLAPLHITVNSISPGWISTDPDTILTESDHTQHPSGRVGRPGDIAGACIFLARRENDFINGQDIVIDGGMTRRMIYV